MDRRGVARSTRYTCRFRCLFVSWWTMNTLMGKMVARVLVGCPLTIFDTTVIKNFFIVANATVRLDTKSRVGISWTIIHTTIPTILGSSIGSLGVGLWIGGGDSGPDATVRKMNGCTRWKMG